MRQRLTVTEQEYLDVVLPEEEERLKALTESLKQEYGEGCPVTEEELLALAKRTHGVGPTISEFLSVSKHVASLRARQKKMTST